MMESSAQLLATLGFAVLRRESRGAFVPLWQLPDWCTRFGPETFRVGVPCSITEVLPFFELFLEDAEVIWCKGRCERLDSQGFTQVLPDGKELRLFATALRSDECALLIIFQNEQAFAQEQLLLQRGRELRATHDALAREIEQRDVLTHCVVHDLRNPLTAIVGALEMLQRAPLKDSDAQLLALAREAANQQSSLIAEVLTSFSDRWSTKGRRDVEDEVSTDLVAMVGQVTSMLEATARARGVRLQTRSVDADLAADGLNAARPIEVCAEPMRLFRVIGNLLENALRYSGPGAIIRISIQADREDARVVVEDEGPGVPASFAPFLFKKFARAASPSGTGLGLYFCRITVESWGGAIGYEPRPEGGSRFWFRLLRGESSP